MPIDPLTEQAIIAEVNSLVDGAGVGFVKVRVRGHQAPRIYTNTSKALPSVTLPATPQCPRDNVALVSEGAGESRRYRCPVCQYAWRREQLVALLRASQKNGSVRASATK